MVRTGQIERKSSMVYNIYEHWMAVFIAVRQMLLQIQQKQKKNIYFHHMAMALEEFTGWIWYSRDLLVASSVIGTFHQVGRAVVIY